MHPVSFDEWSAEMAAFTATKLQIGATIGIPTASLCITRRLFYISRASTLSMDRKDVRIPSLPLLTILANSRFYEQKIKQVVTDASIGILIPIVFMALRKFLSSLVLVRSLTDIISFARLCGPGPPL